MLMATWSAWQGAGSWYAQPMRRFSWVFTTYLFMGFGCEQPSTEVKETDLCEKTINHMMSVMSGASEGAKMGVAERVVDGMAAAASIATCRQEGLSPAQADCILAAKNFEQFRRRRLPRVAEASR
jgi:hypothetical protein